MVFVGKVSTVRGKLFNGRYLTIPRYLFDHGRLLERSEGLSAGSDAWFLVIFWIPLET